MRTEPPWSELDPGIVEAVRVLWAAGYQPTDSGDGSKERWMEDAMGTPHVFCTMDPSNIVHETERAARLPFATPPAFVQANYSPGGPAILMLIWDVTPGASAYAPGGTP